MAVNQQKIQQRFEGFLKTPNLWKGATVFGLEQFAIDEKSVKITIDIDENQRLGRYIEAFVFYQLQQVSSIQLIATNIQIQDNKLTMGELDCLLMDDDQPVHLEIIYKFYLYDNTIGTTEIEHFIGPNRKDSLIEKLTKLKQKQLPLLFSNACKNYLTKLNVTLATIKQLVYFKAQLFVPYLQKDIQLQQLNQNAIVGYYCNLDTLVLLKDCKFYIPTKKDWLIIPHQFVKWIFYDDFNALANNSIKEKYSFLCWIKKPNGIIDKVFIVWWS